ncbi:MAG: hypothetical protein FWF23_00375 [Alphaproteobacteria bacterium]|nr:hypothetical protein [Alphaproteobacteria bacterium]MCL2505682.1 hypothetical protein [Alphaproteobacteria bacterium]
MFTSKKFIVLFLFSALFFSVLNLGTSVSAGIYTPNFVAQPDNAEFDVSPESTLQSITSNNYGLGDDGPIVHSTGDQQSTDTQQGNYQGNVFNTAPKQDTSVPEGFAHTDDVPNVQTTLLDIKQPVVNQQSTGNVFKPTGGNVFKPTPINTTPAPAAYPLPSTSLPTQADGLAALQELGVLAQDSRGYKILADRFNALPPQAQGNVIGILRQNGLYDAERAESSLRNGYSVSFAADIPAANTANSDTLEWDRKYPWDKFYSCIAGQVQGNYGSGSQTDHCAAVADEFFCADNSGFVQAEVRGVNCKCDSTPPAELGCDIDLAVEGPCYFDPIRTQAARVRWQGNHVIRTGDEGLSSGDKDVLDKITNDYALAACGPSTYDLGFNKDKDYCVDFCKELGKIYGANCKGRENDHRELCKGVLHM